MLRFIPRALISFNIESTSTFIFKSQNDLTTLEPNRKTLNLFKR